MGTGIGAEGISPGLSSVHTTSSHSSQAPHQVPQQYTYGNGIGAWQSANGGSGNYAVTSPSHPRPSYPQVYGSRPGMYSQQQHHGVAHVDQRSPQSHMPSADALAGTAYEHPDHHGFQTPAGQSNAQHATQAHSNPSSAHQMSQPAMSSQVDAYSSSRAPGSFPNTTASPSQQGSFAAYAPLPSPVHHSPTTGFGPRGGLVSPGGSYGPGAGSGMAPPAGYRPYQHFPQPMSSMNGHMLNGGVPQHGDQISQHGAQMSMMPTMMSTYNQQLMYPTPPPATMDRPFRCDQCVQSFSRNHDLKRHKRIHLAIKPFPCNFCNKTFSRKDALKVRTWPWMPSHSLAHAD